MTNSSRAHVLCLRPKADFTKVGIEPPLSLDITYVKPDAPEVGSLIARSRAVVIPAVGPILEPQLFADSPVELVQVTGAGMDRLDVTEMKRLGIAVANIPGGSNEAVAEYVVSTALVLLRRLTWANEQIGLDNYDGCRKELIAQLPPGLGGLTIGIVGLGTIGLAVASAFQHFGCGVIYHDPALKDAHAANAIGAEPKSLTGLLKASDVISLHIPLLRETRNLIDAKALSLMKPEAILINAARGGVIDEAALVTALQQGRLAAAAVDVFSVEPANADNPLIAAASSLSGRLLLTPHVAGITRQAWAKLFSLAWENVEAVVTNGQKPKFIG